HRHAAEQLDPLERPADAEPGALRRAQVAERATLEGHRPPLRAQHAGEAVEQRALAGAVRPDDRDELPGVDVHRHVRQGDDPLEALADTARLEQRLDDLRWRAHRDLTAAGSSVTTSSATAPPLPRSSTAP